MDHKLTIAQPRQITDNPDLRQILPVWHKALDLQVRSGELTKPTVQTYKIGMAKFMTWFLDTQFDQVDPDIFRHWIADMFDRGYKKRTINTWLSGQKAFFRWALDARLIPWNPTATVKGKSRKGETRLHVRKVLTNAEVRSLLEQPDRSTLQGVRDYAILSMFVFTAMRTVEVNRADLADLQTIGNQPVIYFQGKGHTDKTDDYKVINENLADALQDWIRARGNQPGALFTSFSDRTRGQRLSLRALRDIVKTYMVQAGIDDPAKTTHSLRHTAITNVILHGGSLQQAQTLAGHVNSATTDIYVHAVDRLQNPAENLIDYANHAGKNDL